MRRLLLAIAVLALALPASARADTAKDLRKEVTRVADRAAAQWAGLLTPTNVFRNPWPADVAAGHGSFVPPGLAFGVHAAGLRERDDELVRAAERAWPNAVAPERASAFDMLAAAYAYRTLDLTPARKAQLGGYLGRYGIPVNGAVCITTPAVTTTSSWSTPRPCSPSPAPGSARPIPPGGSPTRAPRAPPRRGSSTAACPTSPTSASAPSRPARSAAARSSPTRRPTRPPTTRSRRSCSTSRSGSSDPTPRAPPGAPAARRSRRSPCSSPPPADASYLGRGQDQVWVPAITAAALAAGARAFPARAPRYLGAARAALRRLERLHATRRPRLRRRPRREPPHDDGRDRPLRPHRRLQRPRALRAHRRARRAAPRPRPHARAQAPGRPRARASPTPSATGLAIVADGRTWMAVHAIRRNTSDLRHDLGLLALERRARPPLARPARPAPAH